MNCLNCQSPITCGCQKKTASDGKQVCSSCIQKYEQSLQGTKSQIEEQAKIDILKNYTE
jgi:hypothetical protein